MQHKKIQKFTVILLGVALFVFLCIFTAKILTKIVADNLLVQLVNSTSIINYSYTLSIIFSTELVRFFVCGERKILLILLLYASVGELYTSNLNFKFLILTFVCCLVYLYTIKNYEIKKT